MKSDFLLFLMVQNRPLICSCRAGMISATFVRLRFSGSGSATSGDAAQVANASSTATNILKDSTSATAISPTETASTSASTPGVETPNTDNCESQPPLQKGVHLPGVASRLDSHSSNSHLTTTSDQYEDLPTDDEAVVLYQGNRLPNKK